MRVKDIPNRPLTAIESHLLTTLSGSGRDVFTTRDAEDILQRPNAAVRKVMHRLVQRPAHLVRIGRRIHSACHVGMPIL